MDLYLLPNLWSQILGCPTYAVQSLPRTEDLSKAEVCQPDLSVLSYQYVLQLDISVDDRSFENLLCKNYSNEE